ncbi:MAG: ketoacyl-ACP synthase III [Deltaproteobacteria bacterium]|nr:ketoacyl-ACP synthase III [Deltaproteobacteria bacterium]
MAKIVLTGIGHSVPPHLISNEFFETLDIESSSEWVKERTGIESRYSVLPEEIIRRLRSGDLEKSDLWKEKLATPLAEMTDGAWEQACNMTGNAAFSPDFLICGTSVPDFFIPANASKIAQKLCLSSLSFDVNTACSSFVTNLAVARGMLSQGEYRSAAIFNVERYTTQLDFRDKKTCVLFGDGASCALLQQTDGSHGLELVDVVLHSDPAGSDHVQIPIHDTFSQNGAAVQKFAIGKTVQVVSEIMDRNRLSSGDLRFFIGHQANLRMLQATIKKLGLSPEQHLYNVTTHGNQGAAGAPSVLAQNWKRYVPGDYIVVAVVGSGLTWGAALFRRGV